MSYRILFSLFVFAACCGCSGLVPLPDRNLPSIVEKDVIVGRWTLTAKSVQNLIRGDFRPEESHQNTITFLESGIVEFYSVLTYGFDETYYEVEGTWELKHDVKSGANAPVKNRLYLELSLPEGKRKTSMDLAEDDKGLLLWEFYGDPDSWEFLEYTKQAD